MDKILLKNEISNESGKKIMLVGYYDYTVILTYLGMIVSFVGIVKAIFGDYFIAIMCLMIAGVCDMLDGRVAATKKRTKEQKCFGIQIDSMCDLISFGIFPAILLYCRDSSIINLIISVIYVLCALIRLAYFNVTEEERQNTSLSQRKYYLGLPVTSIALILPIVFWTYESGYIYSQSIFSMVFFIVSIAFILPVKIRKPQAMGKVILVVLGAVESLMLFLG